MLYDRLSDDCMLLSVTRYFQTPSKLPAPRTFTVYTCTECTTRTGKHAPFRCTGYGRPSFSVVHPIESSAVRAKNVFLSFLYQAVYHRNNSLGQPHQWRHPVTTQQWFWEAGHAGFTCDPWNISLRGRSWAEPLWVLNLLTVCSH